MNYLLVLDDRGTAVKIYQFSGIQLFVHILTVPVTGKIQTMYRTDTSIVPYSSKSPPPSSGQKSENSEVPCKVPCVKNRVPNMWPLPKERQILQDVMNFNFRK